MLEADIVCPRIADISAVDNEFSLGEGGAYHFRAAILRRVVNDHSTVGQVAFAGKHRLKAAFQAIACIPVDNNNSDVLHKPPLGL